MLCYNRSSSTVADFRGRPDSCHFCFLQLPASVPCPPEHRTLRCVWDCTRYSLELSFLPEEYPFTAEVVQVARNWISDCQNDHPICSAARLRDSQLPKRVLDVSGLKDTCQISLHVPSHGETGDYATLSYCWGTSGVPLRTTKANLQEHRDGISIETLPATIKNAAFLVWNLGIPYLWVDALCIIQEGDEGHDWAEQSAEMTSIYQGGTLNISAVDGRGCESGLKPEPFQNIGRRVGTSTRSNHVDVFLVCRPVSADQQIDSNSRPLSVRGWAFQERLVSSATLHFTNRGMAWECCTTSKMERLTTDDPGLGLFDHEMKQDWSTHTQLWLPGQVQGPIAGHKALQGWYNAMLAYPHKALTFERDCLPALAGIAATISKRLGFTYLAGLWKEDIAHGLCWRAS
ncbi:heterokaryon incompatibility protein-domain-containing protein [Immersiella caudata]|uniref:Heterokaryon incompatibility protein-domain-containing protein n=1 Tax=Immersiella caudata TaxID=314043 RepID=A0AA39XCC2_9PEZI|nr:heterokaryon incompatibility protein-domain-containing protein [Immersiella caudata]